MRRSFVQPILIAIATLSTLALADAAIAPPPSVACDGNFSFRTPSLDTPSAGSNIATVQRDDGDHVVYGRLADPFSAGTVVVRDETVPIPRSTMGIRVFNATRNAFAATAKNQLNEDVPVAAFHFVYFLACDPSTTAATGFDATINGATTPLEVAIGETTSTGVFQCLAPPSVSAVVTLSADEVDSPDIGPGYDVFGRSSAAGDVGTLVVTNRRTGEQCGARPPR